MAVFVFCQQAYKKFWGKAGGWQLVVVPFVHRSDTRLLCLLSGDHQPQKAQHGNDAFRPVFVGVDRAI